MMTKTDNGNHQPASNNTALTLHSPRPDQARGGTEDGSWSTSCSLMLIDYWRWIDVVWRVIDKDICWADNETDGNSCPASELISLSPHNLNIIRHMAHYPTTRINEFTFWRRMTSRLPKLSLKSLIRQFSQNYRHKTNVGAQQIMAPLLADDDLPPVAIFCLCDEHEPILSAWWIC